LSATGFTTRPRTRRIRRWVRRCGLRIRRAIGAAKVLVKNGVGLEKWLDATITSAGFFQVRVTFVSNAETLLTPQLSALGFAFRR